VRKPTCRWEPQVRLGRVPETVEFVEHLSSCAECQEGLAVRNWLQEFAATPLEGAPVPGPALLWLKGQTLQRWEQERRSSIFAERMQVGLGVAGAFGLFAWLWQQLSVTGGSELVVLTAGTDFSRALPGLLVISLFLLLATISTTARDLFAR
jgi:hypothetical protein